MTSWRTFSNVRSWSRNANNIGYDGNRMVTKSTTASEVMACMFRTRDPEGWLSSMYLASTDSWVEVVGNQDLQVWEASVANSE
jgi:hypothetical protein